MDDDGDEVDTLGEEGDALAEQDRVIAKRFAYTDICSRSSVSHVLCTRRPVLVPYVWFAFVCVAML